MVIKKVLTDFINCDMLNLAMRDDLLFLNKSKWSSYSCIEQHKRLGTADQSKIPNLSYGQEYPARISISYADISFHIKFKKG